MPYPSLSKEECLCSVGLGWSSLIEEIWSYLEKNTLAFSVQQVKEKFGGLRFYFTYIADGDINCISDHVDEICDRSTSICEDCGKPGNNAPVGGWWLTLCYDCRTIREKEMLK